MLSNCQLEALGVFRPLVDGCLNRQRLRKTDRNLMQTADERSPTLSDPSRWWVFTALSCYSQVDHHLWLISITLVSIWSGLASAVVVSRRVLFIPYRIWLTCLINWKFIWRSYAGAAVCRCLKEETQITWWNATIDEMKLLKCCNQLAQQSSCFTFIMNWPTLERFNKSVNQ